MNRRAAGFALFATAIGLTGCGQIMPPSVSQKDVSGIVNGPDGKPLKDLTLNFQPTGGNAQQTTFVLKADGSFSGKMNAGTYTYFISNENRKNEAAIKALPENWKEGSLNRQIDFSGGKVELKF